MTQPAFTLTLPPPFTQPNAISDISNNGVVVIVGANGSGKSRLGVWIELTGPQQHSVHRVAAQKSLMMPEISSTTNVDAAETSFIYGDARGRPGQKVAFRYQNKPHTTMLNDFDKLMILLFSEEAQESTKYRQSALTTMERVQPPITKLDVVKQIWEAVLPHRQLQKDGGKIEAKIKDGSGTLYNGAEMSDGERVIFYLIGECLLVKPGTIIVIDEPELHLHKALQATLWDAIEAERPDCQFVYVTHDLDFAASRVGAPKVCVKSYNGTAWDWYLAPESDDIPEDLMLQIIGSRKPVLFVEGDKTSLDIFLFNHLYPSHKIIPMKGCREVIHATNSFAALKHLHSLECAGIIDRDHRQQQEIDHLRTMNVYVLEVAEIENLCLIPDVLQAIANKYEYTDFAGKFVSIQEVVFNKLQSDKERVASELTAIAIEDTFTRFDAKAQGNVALQNAMHSVFTSIDVSAVYSSAVAYIEQVIANRNYIEAIKIYSNKGLLAQVSRFYDTDKKGLLNYIKRLLIAGRGEVILNAMRQYVPALPM